MRALVGPAEYLSQLPPPPAPRQQGTAAPPRQYYPVVRVRMADLGMDTVVQLQEPQPPRPPRQPVQGSLVVPIPTAPLVPADLWAGYADGTVVVVRSSPYRLEYHPRGGARQPGPVIPVPSIEPDDGFKKDYVDEAKRTLDQVRRGNPMAASLTVTYEEPRTWPKRLPPFLPTQDVTVDGQDRLWCATWCASSRTDTCIDVIARDGTRDMRLRVPGDATLLGLGATSLYVGAREKDQLVVHRYALPVPR
jgi:hypothetical protein